MAEPGCIVIKPARPKPSPAELLARMAAKPTGEEVDYGPPRGRELL